MSVKAISDQPSAIRGSGLKAQGSRKTPIPNLKSQIRRGISLLEVLISIGVISVGLLGVAALLPLAQHLANKGTTADRAALSGKAAMVDFKTRDMANPDNWLTSTGAAVSLDPTNAASPLNPSGAMAYCLDPRLLSRDATATVFPAHGTGATMPRLTLRKEPGGAAVGATNTAMPPLLADYIFTVRDDLTFQLDKANPAVPPVQTMEGNNARRAADDDFTWLANLVRETPGDRYTLSVVVIYRRGTPSGGVRVPTQADEKSLAVTFLGSGIGGGDVTVTGPAAAGAIPGQWIFLTDGSRFRWYRIVYASELKNPTAPASHERELTLAGRDWGDTTTNGGTATGTMLPGVVAVYERTIRLETSNLWQR